MENKITFKISAKNEAKKEFINLKDEAKLTKKEIDKIFNEFDNGKDKIKNVNSELNNTKAITKGIISASLIQNMGHFLVGLIQNNNEINLLNNKIKAMTNNSKEAATAINTIKNFEGNFRFDNKQFLNVFNDLRKVNKEMTEDIMSTISDVALKTGKNIDDISKMYINVQRGNIGSLEDIFDNVVKTSEGLVVNFKDKNNEVKTMLLKDADDLTSSLNKMAGGITEKTNEMAINQFQILKNSYLNHLRDELNDISSFLEDLLVRTHNFFKTDFKKLSEDFKNNNIKIDIEINENYEKALNKLKLKEIWTKDDIDLYTFIAENIDLSLKDIEIFKDKINNMDLDNKTLNIKINETFINELNELKKLDFLDTDNIEKFKLLSQELDISAKDLMFFKDKYKELEDTLTPILAKKEDEINNYKKQQKEISGLNILLDDYMQKIDKIKNISDFDNFFKGIDAQVKNILGEEGLLELKKYSDKAIAILQNQKEAEQTLNLEKYKLQNKALENNLDAKIELIKLNFNEEINLRRKNGELSIELEKEIRKRETIEIKKITEAHNKLLNSSKIKDNSYLIEKEIEMEREKQLRIRKIKEQIENLSLSSNSFLNKLEREEILEKNSLLNKQKAELDSKKITTEERTLIEQKHLLEIEELNKKHLEKREELERTSNINIMNMKLKEFNNFRDSFEDLGDIGDFSFNFVKIFEGFDSDLINDKKELLLEKTRTIHAQEIKELEDRNAKMEEIELKRSEHLEQLKNIEEEYSLGSLKNISENIQGLSSILNNIGNIVGNESKEMFRVQQAVNIAQAIMNTYTAATKALAEGGPYFGPVLAGSITALGLANVAQISAQKPKFHGGGYVGNTGGGSEINATLLSGEGVLSRKGMESLGKLNRGEDTISKQTMSSSFSSVYLDKDELIEQMLKDRRFKGGINNIVN